MSQTALQICNSALIKIGAKTITSLDDGSKPAELCTARYPTLRDMLLRDHVWSFSKAAVTLSALAEASPVYPWDYQLQLPSDCARIVGLSVEDNELQFERIGQILHVKEDEADLRYIQNFSDVDDGFAFPDDFAEVLANLLAAEIAVSLTQTQSLRDDYLNMYQERLRQARFNGAVERNDQPVTSSSWTDAHDTGSIEIDPSRRGLSGY